MSETADPDKLPNSNCAGPVRKVLVVDDEEDVLFIVAKLLKDNGYEPTVLSDSRLVLDCLKSGNFPLALIDLWMPSPNGLELLDAIGRACPETRVVIMTAAGDWDTYMECRSHHAVDCISKPVRRAELLRLVQLAFDRRAPVVRGPATAGCH
jgi:DNA-binding NtrC family response regulator